MIKLSVRLIVIAVVGSLLLVGQQSTVEAKPCSKKIPVTADTRPGRCPHPQYAFSSLPCSVEGNDTVCPWGYKCCPLIAGMQCFAPCAAWSEPCRIKCPFGLKVSPSPCTICECAESPCLSAQCPRGKQCDVTVFEPCASQGACGYTYKCVANTTGEVNPVTKPKQCPDYWPGFLSGGNPANQCFGSDGVCPGAQKCCVGPSGGNGFPYPQPPPSDGPVSYCAEPCDGVANCTLSCQRGLKVVGGCRVCQCVEDGCLTTSCPPGKRCQLLPAPCARYPGMPPCPYFPVCL